MRDTSASMVHLDAWLPRAAAQRPAHPALLTAGGPVSYAELRRAALDAAAALAAAGVGAADRVAVALPAGVPFVATLHACLLLGAAIVPIDLRLAEGERARRAAGAALLVERPLVRGDAPDAPVLDQLDPNAIATVMHTSGTTALPKPVELTISNWIWNALGSAVALGVDAEDRWLCTLPLSHVGGLSILLRSAIYGTTVVLHERFDATAAARAINDERVTLASLVGTTLQRVLDAGAQGHGSLRCALIGGGPLPPALALRAAEAGIPVAQTYGMTEACSQVTTSLAGEPETAGVALIGQRVTVSSEGEILVAGATVSPSAALDAEGWLHTGDLGALDERGRLVVTGRRADTIVSGGENVAPQEVEAALLAHPAVADAGVYGRPDDEWGEVVLATVVLHDGSHAEGEELREHVAAQLARFKVPKAITFAGELPRTVSGKLLRRELSGRAG